MSTEAASPATNASATSHLSRPPRSSTTGSSRFNSSRSGPRRGGATRGGAKSPAASPTEDWSTAQEDPTTNSSEEVAQLKIKYANQLKVLRDIFPDWSSEDLVFALQEVDGDIAMATDRIAGGT
jgi:CUE domain